MANTNSHNSSAVLSRTQQLYLGGEGRGSVCLHEVRDLGCYFSPIRHPLLLQLESKGEQQEKEGEEAAGGGRGCLCRGCAVDLSCGLCPSSILSFLSSILTRAKLLLLVKCHNMRLRKEEQPLVFQQ